MAIDLVALKSALATSRATTLGTVLDFNTNGDPSVPSITFSSSVSPSANGENYTNDQVTALYSEGGISHILADATGISTRLTSYDVFTMTIGGKSATASIVLDASATSATGIAAAQKLVQALGLAWEKYATGGASATMSLFDTTSNTAVMDIATKSSLSGSRGFGAAVEIAWTTKATALQVSMATAGASTSTIMDWVIGSTEASSDNTSVGTAIIMTLAEDTNLVTTAAQGSFSINGQASAKAGVELATTLVTGPTGATDTSTTANIYPTDARGIAVNREVANEGTTTAVVARTLTDRSQWTYTGS
jgi:hypothetical protein